MVAPLRVQASQLGAIGSQRERSGQRLALGAVAVVVGIVALVLMGALDRDGGGAVPVVEVPLATATALSPEALEELPAAMEELQARIQASEQQPHGAAQRTVAARGAGTSAGRHRPLHSHHDHHAHHHGHKLHCARAGRSRGGA